MEIIAAGVWYSHSDKSVQSVVIITDSDGNGRPEHLNPHRQSAQNKGDGWIEIPASVYSIFTSVDDLVSWIVINVPGTLGGITGNVRI